MTNAKIIYTFVRRIRTIYRVLMNKKRILYFMPDNPVRKNAGNKTRALQLLQYFSCRADKVEVDFVSEEVWGMWDAKDKVTFKENFPEINLSVLRRKPHRKKRINYLFFKLKDYLLKHKWLFLKPQIPNRNTYLLQKQFDELLDRNQYDYIIISYVEWATLIKENRKTKKARLIVDTHDFITAQQKNSKNFKLGKAFQTEISLLSLFDESWLLSSDEQFIFSQFAEKTVQKFVPLMFPTNDIRNIQLSSRTYDIIYLASENSHNIKSAKWFFEKVYPDLDKSLKFCVIGKIGSYIQDYPNLEKIPFVGDLSTYYNKSKIAICPMLSGTGVKVKTVEALSYGLPVVCTYRGLDGLPNKQGNGCLLASDHNEFQSIIHQLIKDELFYSMHVADALKFFEQYFELSGCYRKLDKQLFNDKHSPIFTGLL